jgi:integrase
VTVAFGRLCRNLKLEDFRFQDLRRTAASWMRMAGADIHTVAQLLGHKDLRTATRYQHLSPAFLAEAMGKLDRVFGSNDGLKLAENGEERYRSVTGDLALTDGTGASD